MPMFSYLHRIHLYIYIYIKGHCIAGKEAGEILGKDNVVNRNLCANMKQEDCSEMDELCTGRDTTIFAYKLEE